MIGTNIRKIRESKGLGVNELSRLASINSSYLSALERGEKKNPSTNIINKIAAALKVPSELLIREKTSLTNAIVNELYKISDFDALGDMSQEDKLQAVSDILEQDPSIFYELDDGLRTEIIKQGVSMVKEASTEYSVSDKQLPKEAQEELKNFMEYLKHKYHLKGD